MATWLPNFMGAGHSKQRKQPVSSNSASYEASHPLDQSISDKPSSNNSGQPTTDETDRSAEPKVTDPPQQTQPRSMLGTALSITYDTALLGTAVAYSLWRDTRTLGANGDNADVDRHLARTRLAKARDKTAKAIELPPPPPYEATRDHLDSKGSRSEPRRRPSPSRRRSDRGESRRKDTLTAESRRRPIDHSYEAAGSDSSEDHLEESPDSLQQPRDLGVDATKLASCAHEQVENGFEDEEEDEDEDDEPKDAATLELASRIQSLITSGTEALSYQPPQPKSASPPPPLLPPPRTPTPSGTASGPFMTPSRIPLPASPAIGSGDASSSTTPTASYRRHSRRQTLDMRLLANGSSSSSSSSTKPFRQSYLSGTPGSRHRKLRGGSLGGEQSELDARGIGMGHGKGRAGRWSVSEADDARMPR